MKTFISIIACCLAFAFILESKVPINDAGYQEFKKYMVTVILVSVLPFIIFKISEIVLDRFGFFKKDNQEENL